MKKYFSSMLNGLQKKTVFLVLILLVTTIAVFTAVSSYQNKTLVRIVGETRVGQQQAISETSKATMQAVMETMVVDATVQQAKIANKDFSEIAENTYMLQTMAEGILESKDNLSPVAVNPPDPSLDGTPSAMVICEEGVDYTQSEYLGYLAHLSNPMIAMFSNSDKIASCYIGLEDGTFFCIDTRTVNKYDENGKLIPFPVRERPWYRGAIETGDLYFTGIIEDAFAHSLCVTCSAPVVVHGKTVGVVAIDIVLDEMDDFINTSATNTGFGCIINNNGQVILAPKDNSLFKISISSEAEDLRNTGDEDLASFIDQSLTETTDLKTLTFDGKEYYVAGAPMPTPGWALISIVDKEATEAPEKQMLAEYDRINEEATAQFRQSSAQIQTVGRWSVVL
ncbi:MAG: cache domain-containing protein, partial [Solobacterium sp.]|nr:cache domain-containing protein [Solobacterium sp.]